MFKSIEENSLICQLYIYRGIAIVIYVSPEKKAAEKSLAAVLKELMFRELIDGEAIIGAVVLDSSGSPIVHHLPNTLTMKSIRNLTPIIEMVEHAKKITDDLLGKFNYLVLHFTNFKIAFFDINGKGTLIVFLNLVWHVENLMTKIRQFMVKLAKYL